MRNVAWPMKVTTTSSGPATGGRRGSTGTCDGQRVLGVISSWGTRQVGWPFLPLGLKYRRPSKWSEWVGMQEDTGKTGRTRRLTPYRRTAVPPTRLPLHRQLEPAAIGP